MITETLSEKQELILGYITKKEYKDKWVIYDDQEGVVGDISYDTYQEAKTVYDFLMTQTTFFSRTGYQLIPVNIEVNVTTEVFRNE